MSQNLSLHLYHLWIYFCLFSTGAKSKEKRKEEEEVPKFRNGESAIGAAFTAH